MNIINPDKTGICHGFGKTVASLCIRCITAVVRTVFAESVKAYSFITAFSVHTAKETAFVAQKFHLVFLQIRQSIESVKCLVQSEVRYNIQKIIIFYFI